MKKILAVIFTLSYLTSYAFTYTYQGQTVNYAIVDAVAKTCEVRKGLANESPAIGNNIKGELILPEVAVYNGEEYSVVGIGEYGFYGCSELTSVSIPKSVVYIGADAFDYCDELVKAEFASVEALCNISFATVNSNPLDYAQNLYVNGEQVLDVVIPESVTHIGAYAFQRCLMSSISIPASVKSIGTKAFHYVSGLKYAEFGSIESLCSLSFTSSDENPLSAAHHLYIGGEEVTDLVIPESVTIIGAYTFRGCRDIVSVQIPSSVTEIGDWAFEGCSSLESLTLPGTVISIGDYAFRNCSTITKLYFQEGTRSIGTYAFNLCTSLQTVIISSTLTGIGTQAFAGCSALKRVTAPDDLRDYFMGESTFDLAKLVHTYDRETCLADADGNIYSRDATRLVYVTPHTEGEFAIPDGVINVDNKAFYGCASITGVYVPASVTHFGQNVFDGCSSLQKAEFTSIEAVCAMDYGTVWTVTDTSNPISVAHHLYINGQEVTDLEIPSTVDTINMYAFYRCYGLKTLKIGKSVKSIGKRAFNNCIGLTSVVIDTDLSELSGEVFASCWNLEDVTLPPTIKIITDSYFKDCQALTTFNLPDSITTIGNSLFESCKSLSNIAIPSSVRSIEGSAFAGCSLTEIQLPDSLTYIGGNVFRGCLISEIQIPASVTFIGSNPFAGCKNLRTLDIPSTVESFNQCFYDAWIESALILSERVSSVSLSGCWELKKICVPEPTVVTDRIFVKPIVVNFDSDDYVVDGKCLYSTDKSAIYFAHTTLDDDSCLPASLTTIKPKAFALCSDISTVHLNSGITEIGDSAWSKCPGIVAVEYTSATPCTASENIFDPDVYQNATLYVPVGCKLTYMTTEPWSNFYNITESEELSAIDSIEVEGGRGIDYSLPYDVFSMQGVRIGSSTEGLLPGVYILRQGAKTVKFRV